MSLADRTMENNQAKIVGLLTGLQTALQQGWSPLAVVGDSSLVLHQMRDYRRPVNARRFALYVYGKARVFADRIGVTSWTHHLRAWNKMVGAAANVAMDCQRTLRTFHPSDCPEWRGLDALLPCDFAQWPTARKGLGGLSSYSSVI
jgi:ribonuclease HI